MSLPQPKRARLPSAAHVRAPKQEAALAKRLGGQLTKASGAKHEKGDARVRGIVRVECKCTTRKSFSVTAEMIAKIEAAALASGEVPAMEIELLGPDGRPVHRVALVPTWGLDMLVAGREP